MRLEFFGGPLCGTWKERASTPPQFAYVEVIQSGGIIRGAGQFWKLPGPRRVLYRHEDGWMYCASNYRQCGACGLRHSPGWGASCSLCGYPLRPPQS